MMHLERERERKHMQVAFTVSSCVSPRCLLHVCVFVHIIKTHEEEEEEEGEDKSFVLACAANNTQRVHGEGERNSAHSERRAQ